MSAFYDQASLVVVPSGYKSGKIYAQKPLTTDGQLTFTRASTATRVNASGLIETVSSGVPRLDYLGSTCPKLLLEPQRTNVHTYSEQINNWVSFSGSTVTANAAVAPDGATTADKINETSTTEFFIAGNNDTISGSTVYTISFFAKAAERSIARVLLGAGSFVDNYAYFNLSTGATTSDLTTAKMENYGNGWWRCSLTATSSSSPSGIVAWIGPSNNMTNAYNQYAGTAGNGIYAWGMQVEAGAYATSYIPTTTAAVTRLADAASKTGISSLIGQTEGTLFLDFDLQTPVNNDYVIGQIYNSSTPGSAIYFYITNDNVIEAFVDNPGNQARIVPPSASAQGRYKLAIAYKANEFKYYVNGTLIGTDTSGTVPTCNSIKLIDYANGGGYMEKSAVNQYLIFKTSLSNAQLAELTTI